MSSFEVCTRAYCGDIAPQVYPVFLFGKSKQTRTLPQVSARSWSTVSRAVVVGDVPTSDTTISLSVRFVTTGAAMNRWALSANHLRKHCWSRGMCGSVAWSAG